MSMLVTVMARNPLLGYLRAVRRGGCLLLSSATVSVLDAAMSAAFGSMRVIRARRAGWLSVVNGVLHRPVMSQNPCFASRQNGIRMLNKTAQRPA